MVTFSLPSETVTGHKCHKCYGDMQIHCPEASFQFGSGLGVGQDAVRVADIPYIIIYKLN